MTNQPRVGFAGITIALATSTEQPFIERLVDLLDDFETAVTWAVPATRVSMVREIVASVNLNHELALLGDSGWIGLEAKRRTTVGELRRRLSVLSLNGVNATSIVLPDSPFPDHLDILHRHGVNAVLAGSQSGQSLRDFENGTSRCGVYIQSAITFQSQSNSWTPPIFRRIQLRAKAHQVVSRRGCVHYLIHANQLMGLRSVARNLKSLLEFIDGFRKRGQLQAEVLSQSACRHMNDVRTSPARSILQPAV